ncbi:CoA ester lyase [Streptomyces sp. ME02-6987-2C]|uniref:HpcH/HpaI aldolase/citrate lyase family protein n=1 Tax=unclassified Streptomyces TaxID=2593676 RepID=UPI00087CE40B|nr:MULTISPECIES: CoA ester lyase [unclassified Streptomyces]MDX3367438.1 CoA ester lyase [Streptomyces sp. ME02-6987-2C]MDX3423746.1 CoA ester lyase [Streptomyces sp. ME02-6985-2c]REH20644.1 (S)-citramalyl-CoA lyase [Streptomyces sp. 2221.1]SDT31117.1 (S)-citramalyl-CoA lyase [Streptomyces sp. 2114.2]
MTTARTAPGGTWLITPPSDGRLETALRAQPDVVLLDLEDSVPPGDKDAARTAALAHLAAAPMHDATTLGLRVNAPGTVHGLKDLVALAGAGLRETVVLVPKVESARELELVAQVLRETASGVCICALIETPRALLRLDDIFASPVLGGVVFGAADYAAATGCRRTSSSLWWTRSSIAVAAAAHAIPSIDSPYFDLGNPQGLRCDAQEARDLGFTGKGAVHPSQLPIIRAAFRPTDEDVTQAHVIVNAADRADGQTVRAGGQMVGPPLVAAARAVLDRAENGAAPSAHGGTQ